MASTMKTVMKDITIHPKSIVRITSDRRTKRSRLSQMVGNPALIALCSHSSEMVLTAGGIPLQMLARVRITVQSVAVRTPLIPGHANLTKDHVF